MLTQVSPRDMPAPTGATTALDHAILATLADGEPREPREIFKAADDPDKTLQRVHARLRVLVARGVLTRISFADGPRRGPGAGIYQLP